MAVRPFILLGNGVLSRLQGLAAGASGSWGQKWLPQADEPTISCGPAESHFAHSISAWISIPVHGVGTIWMPATGRDRLHGLLFGSGNCTLRLPEPKQSLADEVISQAIADLVSLLVHPTVGNSPALELVEEGSPPPETFRYGSGAVALEYSFHGESLIFILDPQLVSEITARDPSAPKPRPRLDNPFPGLASQTLGLQAWIGEAEMDLATLQTVRVGDVIRLETRLDQPLQIRSSGGDLVCHGYLGTLRSHRAVELSNEISFTGDVNERQTQA